MPSLFGDQYNSSKIGVARGVSGAVSVSLQVALGLGILSMSGAALPGVPTTPLSRPRLVSAVFLSPPVVDIPVPAPPELKAPIEVKAPEPAPERPALVAVRAFENRAMPTPTAPEVRPADVAPPPVPIPPPPTPTLGAFPNAAAVARSPEPVRRVETVGFDVPVSQTPQPRLSPATVGAFDSALTAHAKQSGARDERRSAVVESGFNQPTTTTAPSQPSGTIRETSFSASSTPERPKATQPAAPSTAGFSDARVVEATRKIEVAQKTPTVVPVEVLSKPAPAYTEEARRLKIEGAVVIEVEFCASGAVRIIRVVRGLGHGLDEAASVAAQSIQFKPATSEGRPVDYRTTVQIVFRLA